MKDSKHYLIVAVLIAVVTVIMKLVILKAIFVLPLAASAEAAIIDGLFEQHFWLIAFLFSLIMVFVVYSVVVFRADPDDMSDAEHIHGNTALEIAWTVIPLIIVAYFAVIGTTTLRDVLAADSSEVRIEVTGLQWNWAFTYPELEGLQTTVLALKVGQPVLMEMQAQDVIHSFWVPEFRVKQDLVPGQITYLRFTPTKEGSYKLRCAEMCGLSHAFMLAEVHVLSAADYDAWVFDQSSASNTPEGRGQKLAEVTGCRGCHSIDGTAVVGPSWLDLFGREETLADGSTILVDETYLYESIVCPDCAMVNGFQDLMPKIYADQLTEEQISDLISYIKTLQSETP